MSIKSFLRYAISLCFLALVFIKIDLHALWQEIKAADPVLFALSTCVLLGQIMFLNLRWHALLNAGHHKIPFRQSTFINLAGYFANILLVASVGGVIAKSGLAIKHGFSVFHAFCATILDRAMTLAALVIMTGISLPLLHDIVTLHLPHMEIPPKALLVSVFAVLCLCATLVLKIDIFKRIIFHDRVKRLVAAGLKFVANPKLVAGTTLYSVLAQACFFLAVYVLAQDIDYNGDTLHFLALLPVIALVAALPISFGGWGVREGAFVYGMGLIGMAPESALLLSVQIGVATLVAPFVFGGLYVLCYKPDLKFALKKKEG